MNDENKNEDALSKHTFELLEFYIDPENPKVEPYSYKERIFVNQFMEFASPENIDLYTSELLHVMKTYRLSYVIKYFYAVSKYASRTKEEIIYSRDDYLKVIKDLKKTM